MTDENDDIKQIEADIAALRKGGTKSGIEVADQLEVKLVRMKHKMTRIEQLSIERLQQWMDELRKDLTAHKMPFSNIDTWNNEPLQMDALQALELAWCVSAFRARDTANILGFDISVINAWFKSEAWSRFVRDPSRRANQVASLADLAISRMAHILSIDSNDLEVLKLQERTAADAMTAGLRIPGALTKPKEKGRPSSHRQLGGGDATAARRTPAVTVVGKK